MNFLALKNKIESFFKSFYFIITVIALAYLIWLLKFFISGEVLYTTTFSLLLILSIIFGIILLTYKNTIYTIPITLVLPFTIGITSMGVETFSTLSLVLISCSIVIIIGSIIAHLFIYKPKFELNLLGLSYILVSISFLIPLIYRGFNSNNIIALLGIVYLLVYLFYSNTIKKDNLNYLFRILFTLTIFLSLQLVACFINNLVDYSGDGIYQALIHLFKVGTEPGWGNTNDLTIHITLFSASTIYYMYKYPKRLFPWLQLAFNSFMIILSGSRGSMLTLVLLWIYVIYKTVRDREKGTLKNLYIILGFIIAFASIFYKFTFTVFEEPIKLLTKIFSGGSGEPFNFFEFLDKLSTGRIGLYKLSVKAFLSNPPLTWLFGTGWGDLQPDWLGGGARIIVYHSTFFHVLAIGGILGIAVLFYQLYKTLTFLIKPKYFAKTAILVTYVLTQLHGLIDNTQYMVHYTISTIVMITVLEAYDKTLLSVPELSLN